MSARIITLTTDFGLKDSYVGEMKAAVLSISPSATVVDVTHGVEKFNVRAGAFMLASATPYFPVGTVHVGVVDPGVGTKRRPIIVETPHGCFIGPDNGMLMLAAENQGITKIYEITARRLMLPHVSSTFHGRDVFAPAAAHLLNGVALEEFGPEITDPAKPSFTKITKDKGTLMGEVLHVDDFGNIMSNIQARDLAAFREGLVQIEMAHNRMETKILRSYGETKAGEVLVLIGSHNYLEVAINQGNAAAKFQVKTGDKITISAV